MSLSQANTLFIEFPATFGKVFSRVRYEATVFDPDGTKLAIVTEPKVSAAKRLVRGWSEFSGSTSFHVTIADPNGRRLLTVHKGLSVFTQRLEVRWATGELVGVIKGRVGARIAILDAQGQTLGTLADAATLSAHGHANRDGQRVIREVLTLRPDITEPLRTLAIAAGLTHKIAIGTGTDLP